MQLFYLNNARRLDLQQQGFGDCSSHNIWFTMGQDRQQDIRKTLKILKSKTISELLQK